MKMRILPCSLAAITTVVLAHGVVRTGRAEGIDRPLAWAAAHRLDDTRLLRRASLALFGRAPTIEEYESVLALPADERRAEIYARIEAGLDGPEFADVVLRWGMEYLRVISYDYGYDSVNTEFHGHYSLELNPCAPETMHAGALGNLSNYISHGEPYAICDDPDAELNEIEPWWAPGTTVTVIGAAGTDVREVDGIDCSSSQYWDQWATPGCSCGPNLVYCFRPGTWPDDSNFGTISARRAAFEEPGRLFRHIIANDRPFSDLVLGDYSVMNRGLAFLYVRNGRRNRDNASIDDTKWWSEFVDDEQWREVRFADLHPDLLSDRDYAFDPRTSQGVPEGVPAAGVLSTLGANYAFPRERVRGARWLEIFACREFVPPPGDVEFAAYDRDPGTEGVCQHCHQLIDPAAMHFKRIHGGGAQLGGVGSWDLANMAADSDFRTRASSTFEYDTLMTPVDEATIAGNPNAALIDFMPEDYALFGTPSDGTIGPLGFAKVLVESGEFDACAVRRVHELVAGRDLTPGVDDSTISAYVDAFVASDRSVKALIMAIVKSDEFRIGW
jgi:hypothetical protein